MTDFHVSDVLWERIQPLILRHINHHPRGGRKRIEDRIVFNAILFVARTGCQWNALNATGICSSSTALPCYEPDCVSPAYLVCFTNYGKRVCSNTIRKEARLEMASDGWGDDEGTARRGKKTAVIPQTAEKQAPNTVCSPTATASRLALQLMVRIVMIVNW